MYDIYAPDIKNPTAVSLTGWNFYMERCTVHRASMMWLMHNDHGAVGEGELTYGLGKRMISARLFLGSQISYKSNFPNQSIPISIEKTQRRSPSR